MRKKILAITPLFVALLLVSCSSEPTSQYEYFLMYPNEIRATYDRCSQLTILARQQDKGCAAAIKAGKEITELLKASVSDPSNFGETIVNTQVELVAATDLSVVRELKFKLATYYAVIRLRTGKIEA